MQATNFSDYNISVNFYNAGNQGFINIQKNCNSIMVTNLGDTIATINGIVLFPSATPATVAGDTLEITGNELDSFKGNLKLAFNFPVGASPLVQIVQQFYV